MLNRRGAHRSWRRADAPQGRWSVPPPLIPNAIGLGSVIALRPAAGDRRATGLATGTGGHRLAEEVEADRLAALLRRGAGLQVVRLQELPLTVGFVEADSVP